MIKYTRSKYTNLTNKGINHAKNRTTHIKLFSLNNFMYII